MKKLITIFLLTLILSISPAEAVKYTLDSAHTTVGFSIKHMVISNVKGTFSKFTGEFELDDNNNLKDASAVISVDSIDTNIEKRDAHLKNPDFFDAAKYPEITFTTTSIESNGEQKYTITGNLTMHGVTKSIDLKAEILGPIKDPWGNTRTGLVAHGILNRRDFGLNYSKMLEAGGLVVGDEVTISFDGEGIRD
ncbi:MAG: polyisoprenoid-binding protein [Nitrospira sp.]|nr:polyisoprenoid-binding protein [bacterium]MBL7050208.1 polyisoprenoid-binding protein [Nitrospira sp.]